MKKEIKIKFQNGLSFKNDLPDILSVVEDLYDFIESDAPDFIVFGPYGNDIPPAGNYIRIGYFCENFTPDFTCCEWAFGVPREDEIQHPAYKRIQWHGIDPESLVKGLDENDIDRLVSRNKFCNFLYSNRVPYRESFFKQLSKYKRIDAPGKSMTNMLSLGNPSAGNRWEQKRDFLSEYKFSIAFENYCYPGYQTEKLYDAMQANSLPIYCGDPYIDEIFNTSSFFNLGSSAKLKNSSFLRAIEKESQPDFKDMRPQFYQSPKYRIRRKLKAWGRQLKMQIMISEKDIRDLVERVVETDNNPSLHANILRQPWLNNNKIPESISSKSRWQEIFG